MAYVGNTSFSQLITTTLDNLEPNFTDNIIEGMPLLNRLKEKGRIKKVSGGKTIVRPLLYNKNALAKWITGMETIPLSEQTILTSGQWNWKECVCPVVYSDKDVNMNSGEGEIVPLVEALIETAQLSLQSLMSQALFSDGTGSSSKEFTGLKAMVISTGTYAGIDRTTETWWAAGYDNTSEALDLADMRTAVTTASKGNLKGQPDLVITTDTLYNKFEALTTAYVRYQNTKLLDAGFDNMRFKSADVIYDENCTATYMYFLNTNFIEMIFHQNGYMKKFPAVRSNNQLGEVILFYNMGNLITRACKKHYLLAGRTA